MYTELICKHITILQQETWNNITVEGVKGRREVREKGQKRGGKEGDNKGTREQGFYRKG